VRGLFLPTCSQTYPLAFCIAICQYVVMVCPYCQHTDTSVTNSRQHRREPRIWRRRRCSRCKTTFTTYEELAKKDLPHIKTPRGTTVFSVPRLMSSIYTCLPTTSDNRADDAYALATTVYMQLSAATGSHLSLTDITTTTYEVISRFDPTSGLRYGVDHGIITPQANR